MKSYKYGRGINIDSFEKSIDGSNNHRLTTIVATDICGYSSLSEQDDSYAISLIDDVYILFQKAVKVNHGRVFKRVADGFLAEFPNAESAVIAAIEFTKTIKEEKFKPLKGFPLVAVRTGLHTGNVVTRADGDLLGHGVNVAVRLQEQAHKNGILASHNIIDLIGPKLPLNKTRRGILQLKNIRKPIEAFDILDFPSTPINLFKHKVKAFVGKPVQLGVIPVATLSIIWIGNVLVKSNLMDARLQKVQDAFFSDTSISAYDEELNASYLHRILQDLSESKQPSDQTVFALIETGDVDGAVAMLEPSLEELDKNDPKFLNTLHQIGALTYQRRPQKARSVYKDLITVAPKDVAAITRLGRSYDVLGNVCKARDQYKTALNLTPKGTDPFIKLELDLAFNFIMGGDAQKSLDVLKPYVEEFRRRNPDPLWSLFQTEYGIALERAGKTQLSNAVLSAAVHIQENLADDANLSRSYNILGGLAVRNAQDNPDFEELYHREAIGYFFKQLEIDKRIGRLHTLPGAHYYIGDVYQNTGDLGQAQSHFKDGLSLANEYSVPNFQFLNLIGLAEIEDMKGHHSKACDFVAQAQSIYDEHIDSGVGPKTKIKINRLDCGFTYKAQSSLTVCDD